MICGHASHLARKATEQGWVNCPLGISVCSSTRFSSWIPTGRRAGIPIKHLTQTYIPSFQHMYIVYTHELSYATVAASDGRQDSRVAIESKSRRFSRTSTCRAVAPFFFLSYHYITPYFPLLGQKNCMNSTSHGIHR